MSNAAVFETYLSRFTGGDIDGAAELLAEDFAFQGPMLQSSGKAEFLAGSGMAAATGTGGLCPPG